MFGEAVFEERGAQVIDSHGEPHAIERECPKPGLYADIRAVGNICACSSLRLIQLLAWQSACATMRQLVALTGHFRACGRSSVVHRF